MLVKILFLIIGVPLILLGAAGAALLAYGLQVSSCVPPRAVAVSPELAEGLATRARLITRFGPGTPFSERIEESEASSYLAYRLPAAGLRQPRVYFAQGRLCLGGALATGVGEVPFAAAVDLGTQDGVPTFRFAWVKVWNLAAPGAVVQAVTDLFSTTIDRAAGTVRVTDLVVQEGSLQARGTYRGR